MAILSKIAVDAGTPPFRIGLVQIILVARREINQACGQCDGERRVSPPHLQ